MPLQPLLERAIDQIPECQAAAVMDLATGMVLATHYVDDVAARQLDLLLPASELFQERGVARVDRALSPEALEDSSREVLIVGALGVQVFLRGKYQRDIVLVTLVDHRAEVSDVLRGARRVLGAIEQAL